MLHKRQFNHGSAGGRRAEARSGFDDSQQYRDTDLEEYKMQERQPPLTSRFRTLVELTLTLLKEIERLKNMQELQALGQQRRLSLKEELCRLEIEMIRKALIETGGHQSRAARLLGVKVTTLHEKIKRYGIDPDLSVENKDNVTSFEVSDDDEL